MAEQEIIQRQIAYKIGIINLLGNPLIKQEGWLPNYVLYGSQKVSRVNLIGTVISAVSAEQNYIIIDDGQANIAVRKFETQDIDLSAYKIGNIVNIIGKVREFMNEKYIMPEMIRKSDDAKLLELRKKEIELLTRCGFYKTGGAVPPDVEALDVTEEEMHNKLSAEWVLQKIKEYDKGNGADISQLVSSLGPECEKIINIMLIQGDIFSTCPGKIKVLE